MGSLFRQILVVAGLAISGIRRRLLLSSSLVFAVALVSLVLLAFLAVARGFERTVEGAGASDVAMVLSQGARLELNSSLSRDELDYIAQAPGLARGRSGDPLLSPEESVVVEAKRRDSGVGANLLLRGVGPNALQVRPSLHITQGRAPSPGSTEILVGRNVQREFQGFELGRQVRIGRSQWTVTGVFDAGGSVFDSEVWGDLSSVQDLFNRQNEIQSVRVRLVSAGAFPAFHAFLHAQPRLRLGALTERDYYRGQSQTTTGLIRSIGWPLAALMSFGAVAGALNAMYSAVSKRSVEIATLRAHGFAAAAAFWGTLSEAAALCLLGAAIAVALAAVIFRQIVASSLGASFTEVVFKLELSSADIVATLVLAVIIALVGGVFPAAKAARRPIAEGLTNR